MNLRWRRVLIGFGIAVGAAHLYLLVFGAPFVLIKRDFKDPAMWKVPVAIPNLAMSSRPGLKLSYFGWEFEVPWKDLDTSQTKPIGKPLWQRQVIGFHSGALFLSDVPQIIGRNFCSRPAIPIPRGHTSGGCLAQIPRRIIRSRMLEATPDQLTPFSARLTALLMLKSTELLVHDAKSGIFTIYPSGFRGFQYGNPESSRSQIDDVLYSDKGGVEFRFRSRPPKKASISQADINRVIRTVKSLGRESDQAAKQ